MQSISTPTITGINNDTNGKLKTYASQICHNYCIKFKQINLKIWQCTPLLPCTETYFLHNTNISTAAWRHVLPQLLNYTYTVHTLLSALEVKSL